MLLTFFSLQTGGGDLQQRENVQAHIPEDAREALPKGSVHRLKPRPPAQTQTFRDVVEDDSNTYLDQPQLPRQPEPQLAQQPPKPQPRQRPQPEPSDHSQEQQLLLDRIRELELRIAQLEASRPLAPFSDANAKRFDKCVYRVELDCIE